MKQPIKSLLAILVLQGQVKTTRAKARIVRRVAEKLVTKAKKQTLAARRQVLAFLSPMAAEKLFKELALGFKNRPGGFTRIVKIGKRLGDNAPEVILKWVEQEVKEEPKQKGEKAKENGKKEVIKKSPKLKKKKPGKTNDRTNKT